VVPEVFEIGAGVRSFGDTAGATIAIPYVLGYTSRPRHQAPPLCVHAGFEGQPRTAVFDYRTDALVGWHALQLCER
jgi:hypothetical protein